MFTRETIDDGYTLTTDRLALRWPRLADGSAIESLAGRKSVAEMTALVPHPYPEGASGQFIFASRLANARGDGLTLAITEKKRPRELIGIVAVQPAAFAQNSECRHPFIGFWLGVEFWGRGYASEAVGAAVDLAFQETDTEILGAEALTGNLSSLRVLQKLGFENVGSGLSPYPARGGMLPVARMERPRTRAGIAHVPALANAAPGGAAVIDTREAPVHLAAE